MVTLIGEGITVDELAHHFGTIGYEVLTSLGRRYARIYKGGTAPPLATQASAETPPTQTAPAQNPATDGAATTI
jgi:alanine racemase